MNTYTIYHNGKKVGEMKARNARDVAPIALERWGAGSYDIKLVRPSKDEEE